ncbi:MAG: guanylate kinase [Clostridiales bacterium]|nr:guanylate kinase [Clostridiales bacterium]
MKIEKMGLLIILSGPSGSGKDTVLNELSKQDDDIKISISLTTRPKRDWEIDGVHYYFVAENYFLRKIECNQILEYAVYNGNYYGTPKSIIDQWLANGETVILKIEVQGAQKIREIYPDAVSIFLMPPSMKILKERLFKRESEKNDEIQRRLSIAIDEIKRATEYNYIVVNDLLDYAVSDIRAIIRAERQSSPRLEYLINEVIEND